MTDAPNLRQAALDYHAFPKPGKLEVRATKPLANGRDLARAYSPGVAEACLEIKADPTTADALSHACSTIAATVSIAAITVFTFSGSTARRVARERPSVPMLVLTPQKRVARRVALLWGAHPVITKDIEDFEEMIGKGKRMALRHGFGEAGNKLIVLAGVPFGTPGSTNLLHVVSLSGDELKGR